MEQFTREQAIAFGEAESWKPLTFVERATFQLQQSLLCMPFGAFHEAVEKALARPVYTHEFADRAALLAELQGKVKAPTFDEILAKLPADKTIVIVRSAS